jgi:hypothetical protein
MKKKEDLKKRTARCRAVFGKNGLTVKTSSFPLSHSIRPIGLANVFTTRRAVASGSFMGDSVFLYIG